MLADMTIDNHRKAIDIDVIAMEIYLNTMNNMVE